MSEGHFSDGIVAQREHFCLSRFHFGLLLLLLLSRQTVLNFSALLFASGLLNIALLFKGKGDAQLRGRDARGAR
jgi:hypothetical protein